MQRWSTSVIRLKLKCFLPFYLAKLADIFSFRSQPYASTVANAIITGLHFPTRRNPATLHVDVRAHLNANLPFRWIRRASDNDSPLVPWPPRSLDLTLVIFY
jgi:hypothetical protein